MICDKFTTKSSVIASIGELFSDASDSDGKCASGPVLIENKHFSCQSSNINNNLMSTDDIITDANHVEYGKLDSDIRAAIQSNHGNNLSLLNDSNVFPSVSAWPDNFT